MKNLDSEDKTYLNICYIVRTLELTYGTLLDIRTQSICVNDLLYNGFVDIRTQSIYVNELIYNGFVDLRTVNKCE